MQITIYKNNKKVSIAVDKLGMNTTYYKAVWLCVEGTLSNIYYDFKCKRGIDTFDTVGNNNCLNVDWTR